MKKLAILSFIIFSFSGLFSQDVTCTRQVDTTMTGFFITYKMTCNDCGSYAQIRDTLRGHYVLSESALEKEELSLKDGVIKVSYANFESGEKTFYFGVVLDEACDQNTNISLEGYFHYVDANNERKKVYITTIVQD